MIETATGRRTPSGVITSAMPASRAGRRRRRVIADAEAGDDGEPAARLECCRRSKRWRQQDQRVEIGELVGRACAVGGLDEDHLDVRARLRSGDRSKSGIGRRAVGLPEVARQRDAEQRLMRARPSAGGADLSTPPASASCSTQTSPE